MKPKSLLKTNWFVPSLILVFYLVTHLIKLSALPVFADEAIYIRWSQLIIDDWKQYLFFPLNDGKTPLQIWLTVPALLLVKDQLFGGRLISVLAGAAQIGVLGLITQALGGKRKTVWLSMLLGSILPFWFLHHRMALLDSLMTTFATLAVYGSIKLSQQPFKITWILITGLGLGLGMWTKVPTILIFPALLAFMFLPQKQSFIGWVRFLGSLAIAEFLGLVIFFGLKINPAFGQLFNRGSDFLYPLSAVLLHGMWRQTLINVPTYFSYFWWYMTWPVMLLALGGLFSFKKTRRYHILWLSALLFAFPIMLFGKVVYPRYFLPVAIFMTVAASLAFEDFVYYFVHTKKALKTQMMGSLLVVTVLSPIVALSLQTIYLSYTNPDKIPFMPADKVQYLYEWSSGHGIKQTADIIEQAAQTHRVAVATEGYFGTLPDGLLLYLHNKNVQNIYVEGVGYPVKTLAGKFLDHAQNFDKWLLVVNSHRLELTDPDMKLIDQFCRPDSAPCLQVWDITALKNKPQNNPSDN